MLKNLTNVTVAILGAVATSAATLPAPSMATSSVQPFSIVPEGHTQETETKEVVPEKPKVKRLVCKGCNTNETKTVEFLQKRGITDKNALATIMGNIRQESTFTPNICEGGARVPYHQLVEVVVLEQFNGQMPQDIMDLVSSLLVLVVILPHLILNLNICCMKVIGR
jgi:hypothetical protein